MVVIVITFDEQIDVRMASFLEGVHECHLSLRALLPCCPRLGDLLLF